MNYCGRNNRGLLIILAAVVVAVFAATAVLMLTRNREEQSGLKGFMAPTGTFEPVDHDLYLLTNELLVTMKADGGQSELERELEGLEGRIEGYFPAVRQYQVRFNTDSREALDQKKNKLSESEEIEQVHYNFVINNFSDRAEMKESLPEGNGSRIGWLGSVPQTLEDGDYLLYLPSYSFPVPEDLKQYNEQGHGQTLFLTQQEKASIENGRSVVFAADSYYEEQSDERISAYTTSAGLRYQIYELAEAGCEIICCPGKDPLLIGDEYLQEETEQMEALLNTIEADHPDYVICIPYQEDGFLYRVLSESTAGQKHTVFAAPCAETAETILDLSGSGKKAYYSEESLSEKCIAVLRENSSEAAALAAAWMEKNREPSLKEMIDILAECSPGMAFDDSGMIVPALDNTLQFGSTSGRKLRAVKVEAHDAITGQTLTNVQFRAVAGTGPERTASGDGICRIISDATAFTVSAGANGYQESRTDVPPDYQDVIRLDLHQNQETTGTIAGRIRSNAQTLIVSVENVQDGTVYPDRLIESNFEIPMYPGNYHLTFTAHDRTKVTVYDTVVQPGEKTELQDIELTIPSDLPGSVTGSVIDSMNGNTVDNAEIRFYSGVNAEEAGTLVLTTGSDRNGKYSAALPGGAYTVVASKEGYRNSTRIIYAEGEASRADQNCVLTPTVADGQVRIALTWGETPRDLDSHLVNQAAGIHVFFSAKNAVKNGRNVVSLDHDETSSFGPEQTTIMIQEPGIYSFYVHDYSNKGSTSSTALAESGATVTVYVGSADPQVFYVPNRPGTLWKVFTYQNGVVTPSGEMSYHRDESTIGN